VDPITRAYPGDTGHIRIKHKRVKMMRNNVDHMSIGILQVLAGLEFPAQRWQVIAQAQYYGAGTAYTGELTRLPVRTYQSLREVAVELSKVRCGGLTRARTAPTSRRVPLPRSAPESRENPAM
jgi:hypothetical protein